MKKSLLILLLALTTILCKSQSLYFPPLSGDEWETISPESLGWCTDKIDTLLNYLEEKNSKAFIVLKDGKIVIEKYFGTFIQDSLWYWASAGKTLTAFAVGMAQEEGYLSIGDVSSDYLGEGWTICPAEKEDMITVRNQLSMTSGLDDYVPDPYCTIDTCLQYVTDAGTRWAYHNAPYTLLDGVIESATGQTLNAYLTNKIKNPTGMDGLFFPVGYNNVFISTARSMARFGLLILNKGNWDGNQVMTDTAYFNQMINTSQELNKSYGYLWWLNGKESFMLPGLEFVFPGSWSPHAPDDMIAALGKDAQLLNITESENLVFIRMGNSPETGEIPATFNDTIWQKLNDVMCTDLPAAHLDAEVNVLQVYPNPALDYFVIELTQQNFNISVFDLTGKLIAEQKNIFDQLKIDSKELTDGIYFLRLKTDKGEMYSRKIIVAK